MKLKKMLNQIVEVLGNKRAEIRFPKKKIQIEVTQSEYEMLHEFLDESRSETEKLKHMTREERLAYFRAQMYPRKLDFEMDFGTTVLEVNTRFDRQSEESVVDKVERLSKKV